MDAHEKLIKIDLELKKANISVIGYAGFLYLVSNYFLSLSKTIE